MLKWIYVHILYHLLRFLLITSLLSIFDPDFLLIVFLNIFTGSSSQNGDWCSKLRLRHRSYQACNNWEIPTSFEKKKFDKKLSFVSILFTLLLLFLISSYSPTKLKHQTLNFCRVASRYNTEYTQYTLKPLGIFDSKFSESECPKW